MSSEASMPRELRLSSISRAQAHDLSFQPAPNLLDEIIADLGLLGLRKTRLTLRLQPEGKRDWHLTGTLGATAVQPCAVTLDPVTSRIDTQVVRRYVAAYADPTEAEAESPEDDSIEPLPETLDLGDLFAETLALALPDFPRAEGSELGEMTAAPPGVAPLTQADVSPFRALAALKGSKTPED